MSDNQKVADEAKSDSSQSTESQAPVAPQVPPRKGDTFKGTGVQKTKGVN